MRIEIGAMCSDKISANSNLELCDFSPQLFCCFLLTFPIEARDRSSSQMAEARRAVETLPSLTLSEGIDPYKPTFQVKTNHQGVSIFIPGPRFLLRGIIRFTRRTYRKVTQAFMPLPAPIALGIIFGACGWVGSSSSNSAIRNSWLSNFLWNFDSRMPFVKHFSVQQRVAYLTFNTSVVIVASFTALHRFLLRNLLSYTAWLEEGRGKQSLKTKLWGFLLKYVYIRGSGSKQSLLAFQTALPTLPLPSVEATCKRYLESMKPILPPEEYEELVRGAEDFKAKEGKTLQKYLFWKHLMSRNYVSDWWLDVVYLRGRDSIMINSNYYGLSMPTMKPSNRQASRAAYILYQQMRMKLSIDREQFHPLLLQNLVPICMQQYTNTFSLTREPGLEMDRLVKYDPLESRHIVVYYKGKFFKVKMFCERSGRLLSPQELEATFEGILSSNESADEVEAAIPVLTAWNRTRWAEVRRDEFIRNKVNRSTLDIIERAVLFVTFDDQAFPDDDYTSKGHQILHNNGKKIWFDKSATVVFDSNGDWGVNGEHSWGDAPTAGHLLVECPLAYEATAKPYGPDGRLKPIAHGPEYKPLHYSAERLPWKITDGIREAIREASISAEAQIRDFDLYSGRFAEFGKHRVSKSLKCSPDGFIQMALQLAFYRNQGKFVQTYESGMTRLYREGRTETIRSQSQPAVDFVHAMQDPSVDKATRLDLLRKATDNHSKTTHMAMSGRGVDRHLFALYVVAIGTQTESPWLKMVMGRGWKLSTSQVTCTTSPHLWGCGKEDPGDVYPRPSGGFGPVADDGYGVSYCVVGTNSFHFHVSAKKTCEATNAKKMFEDIIRALREMSDLVEEKAKDAPAIKSK